MPPIKPASNNRGIKKGHNGPAVKNQKQDPKKTGPKISKTGGK